MQFTITIPDAQVQRVADWIRSTLPDTDPLDTELPASYTNAELLAEFQTQIRKWIKGEVQQYELLEQHKAVYDAYTQIDVTD
ncbi:MAG: hypothetical protein ACYTFQ_33280 [Planctomycetota bacterium]|jgi:hypothetical protein